MYSLKLFIYNDYEVLKGDFYQHICLDINNINIRDVYYGNMRHGCILLTVKLFHIMFHITSFMGPGDSGIGVTIETSTNTVNYYANHKNEHAKKHLIFFTDIVLLEFDHAVKIYTIYPPNTPDYAKFNLIPLLA